ncbi:MAG: M23 family metallopeptidase [Elusimicrobia bacterium]|nr:M23 family metallopeptidase [Elusimicrobiota bacterium]
MKSFFAVLFAVAFFNTALFATCALEQWYEFEHALRRGSYTVAEAEHNATRRVEALARQFEDFEGESAARVFPLEGFTSANIDRPRRFFSTVAQSQRETGFFSPQFGANEYLRLFVRYSRARERGTINVISVADGIVVFVQSGTFGMGAGNYIWIFNPDRNKFFYYGGLADITVNVGDHVRMGQRIATLRPQRRGYLLNFTVLTFQRGTFLIHNFLNELP